MAKLVTNHSNRRITVAPGDTTRGNARTNSPKASDAVTTRQSLEVDDKVFARTFGEARAGLYLIPEVERRAKISVHARTRRRADHRWIRSGGELNRAIGHRVPVGVDTTIHDRGNRRWGV